MGLLLALVLALQGVATGEPAGVRHLSPDPAATARLEPSVPSQPFLAPREDARAVIGQQQTEPSEKASSGDEGHFAANSSVFSDTTAAADFFLASLPAKSPDRPYDARGPPRRG